MSALDATREAIVEALWTESRIPLERCETLADQVLDNLRAIGALREREAA